MTAQSDLTLDLDAYWMPFTSKRAFKKAPRFVTGAKGVHFTTADGKQVLDGLATLWCVNAGHCHPRIVERIREQAGELDFASSFGLGHPGPFAVAGRVAALAPPGLDHVFFTNSGSEAVDTALKIVIAYHKLRGEGTRRIFVGRERAYHGVNIGGLSVSGMQLNRRSFEATLLGNVDHLAHTQDLATRAFVRGQAPTGAELADELERRIIAVHDASNIAAVIVEPVSGAGGVLIPPAGYLQRLREICDRHGILLVFDEVITGFGRLGRPFASQFFGVTPDLFTFAKGITSGAVPLGGVVVRKEIYDTFMNASGPGVELFHGYTYSGHPRAAAAALGALDAYAEEALFDRANLLAGDFEDGVHSLRGLPNVIDTRNLQLIGAVELAPRPGAPGARALEAFGKCWDRGVYVRPIGDALAICPPLVVEKRHLDQIFGVVADVLKSVA
ncbi:MAG: aminotransferase class III-fold pyridoxal phosphate-dependent enzyme [Burkholderiales bacterium]|nr:aminotransferase class III-fold pyridoxal phosphate-dependent enzyme [Burkholderiales bacterium]